MSDFNTILQGAFGREKPQEKKDPPKPVKQEKPTRTIGAPELALEAQKIYAPVIKPAPQGQKGGVVTSMGEEKGWARNG